MKGVEEFVERLSAIPLPERGIFVAYVNTSVGGLEKLESFRDLLRKHLPEDVLVLVVDDRCELTAMSQRTLAEHNIWRFTPEELGKALHSSYAEIWREAQQSNPTGQVIYNEAFWESLATQSFELLKTLHMLEKVSDE